MLFYLILDFQEQSIVNQTQTEKPQIIIALNISGQELFCEITQGNTNIIKSNCSCSFTIITKQYYFKLTFYRSPTSSNLPRCHLHLHVRSLKIVNIS